MAIKKLTNANNVFSDDNLSNLIYGLLGNDTIRGNGGNDLLDGGGGIDTLYGGAGHDTYAVDNAADKTFELTGQGTDLINSSINWTLAANVEHLTLTGSAAKGTGNALANTLTGNAAANTLSGGSGADKMYGGAGNDTYVVDNAADLVSDPSGIETVLSSVTRTLGTGFEKLTLTGTANISGTGNTLANTLTGNTGANILNGGTGADKMAGGAGNDTYVVDNAGDLVSDTSGIDTVQSSITHTLGAAFEKLTLLGSANINGTGNALANTLTGNTGNNTLSGGGGNDTITGGAGNDSLLGGTDSDVLIGGAGEDVLDGGVDFVMDRFVFNNITDSIYGGAVGPGTLQPDQILNFHPDFDKIDLSGLIPGTLVIMQGGFTNDGVPKLRWTSRENTFVDIDADGNGTGDLTVILDSQSVQASSFIL